MKGHQVKDKKRARMRKSAKTMKKKTREQFSMIETINEDKKWTNSKRNDQIFG